MPSSLQTVPIDSILVPPQARQHFDSEALQQLADSISECGLQQPLLCRKHEGRLILLDGERRLRASKLLGRAEVSVLIAEGDPDATQALILQLVCNPQREDFGPLERAQGIRALMDTGSLTAEQAAKRLGLSSGMVTKSLALLKLPAELMKHVESGALAPDSAYQLARMTDPVEQAELAQQVIDKQLTRDGLARRLKRQPGHRKKAAAGKRFTFALTDQRSVSLVGRELTIDAAIECFEQILAKTKKARTQGLTLQTFTSALRDQSKSGRNS